MLFLPVFHPAQPVLVESMNSRYLILWRHSAGVFRWGPSVAWHERHPESTGSTCKTDSRHVMTLINTTTQSNQNIVDAATFFFPLRSFSNSKMN